MRAAAAALAAIAIAIAMVVGGSALAAGSRIYPRRLAVEHTARSALALADECEAALKGDAATARKTCSQYEEATQAYLLALAERADWCATAHSLVALNPALPAPDPLDCAADSNLASDPVVERHNQLHARLGLSAIAISGQ